MRSPAGIPCRLSLHVEDGQVKDNDLHNGHVVLQIEALQHFLFRQVAQEHSGRYQVVGTASLVHFSSPGAMLKCIGEILHRFLLHRQRRIQKIHFKSYAVVYMGIKECIGELKVLRPGP